MIRKPALAIVFTCIVCFAGSLWATMAMRQDGGAEQVPQVNAALAERLQLDEAQTKLIAEHDPNFVVELDRLQAEFETAREALAAAFETEGVPNEEIEARFEAVLTAHQAMERRVMKYLLVVRDHLTSKQQKRLLGLCAENVREGGRRWRHGRGHQAEDGGAGPGRGQGPGGGRGHGRGRGGHGRGPNRP